MLNKNSLQIPELNVVESANVLDYDYVAEFDVSYADGVFGLCVSVSIPRMLSTENNFTQTFLGRADNMVQAELFGLLQTLMCCKDNWPHNKVLIIGNYSGVISAYYSLDEATESNVDLTFIFDLRHFVENHHFMLDDISSEVSHKAKTVFKEFKNLPLVEISKFDYFENLKNIISLLNKNPYIGVISTNGSDLIDFENYTHCVINGDILEYKEFNCCIMNMTKEDHLDFQNYICKLLNKVKSSDTSFKKWAIFLKTKFLSYEDMEFIANNLQALEENNIHIVLQQEQVEFADTVTPLTKNFLRKEMSDILDSSPKLEVVSTHGTSSHSLTKQFCFWIEHPLKSVILENDLYAIYFTTENFEEEITTILEEREEFCRDNKKFIFEYEWAVFLVKREHVKFRDFFNKLERKGRVLKVCVLIVE